MDDGTIYRMDGEGKMEAGGGWGDRTNGRVLCMSVGWESKGQK